MPSAEALLSLKQKVSAAERERDKAAGAYEAVLARLEAEFGVKTLPEAKALAAKLEKEAVTLEAEYARLLRDFEERYGDKL